MLEHKTCARCKEEKTVSSFGVRIQQRKGTTYTGYESYCRACKSLYAQEWKKRNPLKRQEQIQRQSEKRKSMRKQGKPISGDVSKYGLTPMVYQDMVEKQEGRCLICDRIPSSNTGRFNRLSIDHCHRSGIVRGLLCHTCNMALGQFQDDPKLLRKAAAYLEQST